MAAGKLMLVSGGVRSGKSAYAEERVRQFRSERNIYIASGVARDPEMAARIRQHQESRSGAGWLTIEQPVKLEEALPLIREGDAVLWDCLTTWLANELYDGWETGRTCADQPGCMEQKIIRLKTTLRQMKEKTALLVIVSNEVLDDFIRDERYQSFIGQIHRLLITEADEVIEMDGGIACRRKGTG